MTGVQTCALPISINSRPVASKGSGHSLPLIVGTGWPLWLLSPGPQPLSCGGGEGNAVPSAAQSPSPGGQAALPGRRLGHRPGITRTRSLCLALSPGGLRVAPWVEGPPGGALRMDPTPPRPPLVLPCDCPPPRPMFHFSLGHPKASVSGGAVLAVQGVDAAEPPLTSSSFCFHWDTCPAGGLGL